MTIDHDADKVAGQTPMPPLDKALVALHDLDAGVNRLAELGQAAGVLFGTGTADAIHHVGRTIDLHRREARVELLTGRRQADEQAARLIDELDTAQAAVAKAEADRAGAQALLDALADAAGDEPGNLPELTAVADLLRYLTRLADLGGGRSDGNRLAQEALDRWRSREVKGRTLKVSWSPVVIAEAVQDLQDVLATHTLDTPRRQTLQVALDALRQAAGAGTLDTDAEAEANGADIRNLPTPTDPRLDGRAFAEGIALETIRTGELVSIVTLPGSADAEVTRRAFARRARQ